ncbi:MAG: tetratricopeptide repeat protein [Treponemataceae bacterium]
MKEFDISKGVKLYEAENFAGALGFFLQQEADSLEEATELAYYEGLCYMKLEKYALAIDALEQVVTSSQDAKKIDQCRLLLAIAYAKTGRIKMAEVELKYLEKAYVGDEDGTDLFNALGFIAFEKGDAELAIEYYERVLSSEPENTTAMNGLGYILAESDKDLTRALMLCRKACDAKPNYPPYMDSLAWVYHKLNFPNEAKSLIERVKKVLPENTLVQKHYDEIFAL